MSEKSPAARWIVGILRFLLPLFVLGAAMAGAVTLFRTGPETEKVAREEVPSLVTARTLERRPTRVRVRAFGTVQPKGELRLEAQVSGRVVAVHPDLQPGARLEEGAIVVRIDPRDYDFRVAEAEARVVKAKAALEMEEGRRKVARREWELLRGSGETPETRSARLALREPFIEERRADLASAEASLENARVQRERTEVKLPFPALVLEEEVEEMKLLQPGALVARVVDTRAFRVEVRMSLADLDRLRGADGTLGDDVEVVVRLDYGKADSMRFPARVERVLSAVSPVGRLVRVLVLVEDPLEPAASGVAGPRLFLGSYVRVEMRGPELGEQFHFDRSWIHDGDTFWVMGEDDRLEIREAEILLEYEDLAIVAGPLTEEERVVTSALPVAAPGLLLKIAGVSDDEVAAPGAEDVEAESAAGAPAPTPGRYENGGGGR